ncbi:MAG: DUF4153 domain-containing protein [Saprospiraceae bacterium]|nr:DUF4153 domain-containing protein [Saprospiraceae bacterium]
MSLLSSLNFRGRFVEIIRRFPVVIAFALITTVTLVLLVDNSSGDIFRWPIAGFIGFLAMLNVSLLKESYAFSDKTYWILTVITIGLVGLFYMMIPLDFDSKWSCFWFLTLGLSLVLHFLVAVIPFFKRYSHAAFTNYNIHLFIAWMQAALYGIILYAALSLVILALDNLFDMAINSINYFKLFIIVTGIFHTSFFLSEVPDNFYDQKVPNIRSVFKMITAYVVIPITLIYGVILYAYIFRIVLTDHKMVEWVSVMILWYYAAGILAWLFTGYYENESDNPIMATFRKWYFIFSIPFIILLMISLYKNIIIFGIREDLYLISVCSVFILIITVYFILSRNKDKRIFPLLLILLSIITFVGGPISLCELPVTSQQNKLVQYLEQSGIIKDHVITVDSTEIYKDSTYIIQNTIFFLDSRNGLAYLKKFDKTNVLTTQADSINARLLLSVFQFNQSFEENKNTFEYFPKKRFTYSIDDYEKIIPLKNTYDEVSSETYLNLDQNKLILMISGKESGTFEINDQLLELVKNEHKLNVIEASTGEFSLKIIIHRANGNLKGNKVMNLYLEGIVLLKSRH